MLSLIKSRVMIIIFGCFTKLQNDDNSTGIQYQITKHPAARFEKKKKKRVKDKKTEKNEKKNKNEYK